MLRSYMILGGFLSIFLFELSPVLANTILSQETVSDGVRRVVFLDDNGNKISQFQKCDKKTSGWFEARLDESSKKWVFTAKGERERQAKALFYAAESRRQERQYKLAY